MKVQLATYVDSTTWRAIAALRRLHVWYSAEDRATDAATREIDTGAVLVVLEGGKGDGR